MTATARRSVEVPRLSRHARAVVLTVHVTTSVGWVGLDGALVALGVAGLSTTDPGLRAGCGAASSVIVCWVLVPVVLCALLSGLMLARSTPWGLIHHWWVLVKCAIAAVLAAAGGLLLLPHLPTILTGHGEPSGVPTLIARSLALIMLLVATGLSVVKPWGRTPHGRAKHAAGTRVTPR